MMEDLALNIMDVVQNSLAAGASRIEVEIEEDPVKDLLVIEVRDNGEGMSSEEVEQCQDPFYTTKREIKVGLGIPLFKEAAEHCDGSFVIESEKGVGTRLRAVFRLSHIDRPPLGDLEGTILSLMVTNPHVDFLFRYKGSGVFELDTREVKEMVEDLHLTHPEVLKFLREYMTEGMKEVRRAI
ncbi:MAG: ATP-binding protein [Aquificota bacterium]|nr:MAG: ATP-binding protein [Aquificota bacterium]